MSKKQLLSSQTVLLRGAGRTNIEYSAGPNINITDDVISGRDWSQEMAQIVKGGVSASLSGGDNIQIINDQGVNIISVTGDLYSAGPNIDITDRTISGKDWTDDIDSHIASAISGKADRSDIPEIVEYSAGDNINITDHVISGKDWSYEIGQKVGRDEFISGMSAVTEHMVETVSSTSAEIIDIISATSGHGTCPWISGGKDYGSATEQLQFGSVLPIFSSWGLCADHNHYIWMKGAYIRLPDIDPYLSSYLPLSSFSSYTASTYNYISSTNAIAGSAYNIAMGNLHNKLDISAWSAFTADADVTPYSAGNGIDISDHVISFTGSEGHEYSAGDNINITDNVISGKSWTDEIIAAVSGKQPSGDYYSASNPSGFITSAGTVNKLDISSFTAYTAAHSGDDNQAYSAGQNINVTNHVISGKDWTNEINAATSGKVDQSTYSAYTAAHSGDDNQAYSAGQNINITNHVVSGKDWTNEINAATSGKQPSGNYYSASNPSGFITSGSIANKLDTSSFTAYTAAHSGDDNQAYSAGSNINITDHVVSGKDWSTEITSATSGKADKTDLNGLMSASKLEFDGNGKISAYDGSAFAGGDSQETVPLSAGANIAVIDNETNVTISGKDWTDEIASAVSAGTSGKQDTLIFNYDGDNNISAINGSALAGLGGNYSSESGTLLFSGDNVEASQFGIVSAIIPSGLTAYGEKSWEIRYNGSTNVLTGSAYVVGGTKLKYGPGQGSNSVYITAGSLTTSFGLDYSTHELTLPAEPEQLLLQYSWDSQGSYGSFVRMSATTGSWGPSSISSFKADLYNNYSAGEGVQIVNHVISVTASAEDGKTYSGISPIIVDNTNDTIGLGSATWYLSAGNGITLTPNSSVNALVIAAAQSASGNKVTYEYSSPASAFTSQGDLSIRFATSQSTPARTNVWVGDHNVGLLPPCAVNANSFLMQDYRGSLQWVDASAVVPSSMSAQASYFSKTYTSADEGDTSIDDYPEMNRDWTFNIINWKDIPIYYSAAQGTATLEPGYGVRVHYDLDSNWLDAEPEYYVGDVGMKYATCDMLDNRYIEYVATSAQATESGVLYIITGSN